jgi:hypothetical protein
MKAGRTIQELAEEIQRQQDAKADYRSGTDKLTLMTRPEGGPYSKAGDSELHIDGIGEFAVLPLAHEQIALHLGVPKPFYERLRRGIPAKNNRGARPANTALLDHTVNTLLRQKPTTRLVRTIDGKARAVLSNRYRMLDNFDLAQALLPIIGEMDSPLVEGQLTDSKLYIKVLLPKIEATVPEVGHTVQSGFVITNSEVGLSRITVQPLVYTLVCKNGMILPDHSLKAYHVGKAGLEMDEAYQVFTDATLAADDKAFWMKAQDVVRAAADEAKFHDIVARLGEAAQTEPIADVETTVERVAKKHYLTDGESKGVLNHLAAGGNLTLYGLHSAITRMAQEVESYDRSIELETLGGEVVTMPKNEWKALAAA